MIIGLRKNDEKDTKQSVIVVLYTGLSLAAKRAIHYGDCLATGNALALTNLFPLLGCRET